MKLLGVGISGIGWCAAEHIKAFRRNPHARIVLLHGRDEERARKKLAGYGADVSEARFTKRYEDLLEADDVDIVSITTPNHLHADQAVAAARAGKHLVIASSTGCARRGAWGASAARGCSTSRGSPTGTRDGTGCGSARPAATPPT
jgi:NADPH:quinone reductase-like Zn-dependent oxidoreductase